MAEHLKNVAFCDPATVSDADGTTVEIISASAPISGQSVSSDCNGPSGMEELQKFLSNFNSELAADSSRLVMDTSNSQTTCDSSFTFSQQNVFAVSTLVYQNGAVTANVPATSAQLFQLDGEHGADQQQQLPQVSHGDGLVWSHGLSTPVSHNFKTALSHGLPAVMPHGFAETSHLLPNYSYQPVTNSSQLSAGSLLVPSKNAPAADSRLSANVSTSHSNLLISESSPTIQQHSQEILIPVDCSNALVNGNQLPPGTTVLLPIVPTVFTNGTIEVRIAGQAITVQAPIPVTIPDSNAQASLFATAPEQPPQLNLNEPQVLLLLNDPNCGLQSQPESRNMPTSKMKKVAPKTKNSSQKQGSANVEAEGGQTLNSSTNGEPPMNCRILESTDKEIMNSETPGNAKVLTDNCLEIDIRKNNDQSNGKADGDNSNITMKGGVFQCQLCDYTNVKKYLLQRHLKSHSEDRPFLCTVCDKRFKSANSLQNHVNTHTGFRPHRCQSCEASFTTSGELVRHMRYKHTQEKPHKCPNCEYAAVELSKMKRHLRSHTGEKPFECTMCPYASPDLYKLKRHLRVHTGERPYECDVCLQRFTQSNSLKCHKLLHSGSKPAFQCHLCSATCGRKTDLKIHILKLHETSERPLICKTCGKHFNDRYSLKQHQRTHEPIEPRPFSCIVCGYKAQSQRILDVHKMIHTCEKPYICPAPSCDKAFRTQCQRRRHIMSMHGSDASVHLIDKPSGYDCRYCREKLRSKRALQKHEQSQHSEQVLSSGNGDHCAESEKTQENASAGHTPKYVMGFIESEDEESDDQDEPLTAVVLLYRCSRCNETFKRRVQFENHCQLEHIGVHSNMEDNLVLVTAPADHLPAIEPISNSDKPNSSLGTGDLGSKINRIISDQKMKNSRIFMARKIKRKNVDRLDSGSSTTASVSGDDEYRLDNSFGFDNMQMDEQGSRNECGSGISERNERNMGIDKHA